MIPKDKDENAKDSSKLPTEQSSVKPEDYSAEIDNAKSTPHKPFKSSGGSD